MRGRTSKQWSGVFNMTLMRVRTQELPVAHRFVSRSRDSLDVAFQGELIRCECPDDVVAIKSANVILSTQIECRYASREIEGLAVVLDKYGRAEAAESLRQRNARARGIFSFR